jgi:hypothetical protein
MNTFLHCKIICSMFPGFVGQFRLEFFHIVSRGVQGIRYLLKSTSEAFGSLRCGLEFWCSRGSSGTLGTFGESLSPNFQVFGVRPASEDASRSGGPYSGGKKGVQGSGTVQKVKI